MEKKNIIIPWISICCLLFAMYTGFATEFHYGELDWRFLAVWTVVLSGIAVLMVLLWKPWISGLMTVPALALAGLYGYSHKEKLQEAVDVVQMLLSHQMAKYNGTAVADDPFAVAPGIAMVWGTEEGLQERQMEMLFLLCGFFAAVYLAIVTMRLSFRIYGLIIPYTVVLAGLSMGASPGMGSVLLFFVGTALALYWVEHSEANALGHREEGGGIYRKIPWAFVALCLCILFCTTASIFMNKGTQKGVLSHAKATLEWQHRKERQLRELGNNIIKAVKARFGVDNDGRLDNDSPEYRDKDVFIFTMDRKPEEDIYLKGFVAGDYDNGRWTSEWGEAESELEETIHQLVRGSDQRNWMQSDERKKLRDKEDTQKLYLMEMDAVGLKRTSQGEVGLQPCAEVNWKLEYVGAGKGGRNYYHPYFDWMEETEIGDESQKSDAASVRSSILYDNRGMWQIDRVINRFSNPVRGKFYPVGIQQVQQRLNALEEWPEDFRDWSALPSENILFSDDVLNTYVDYARKRFVKVPGHLQRFIEFADDLGVYGETTVDIAVQIRDGLWKQASYSKNLEAVPGGEDYVEYFLLEQRKGFCEHFATAGTLLFRHYGIPAKFVSGYRIPMEAFVDNGDGTYTAGVQDSYSHAWSEVLVGGLGWYPMEMTPGAAGVVRGQHEEEENIKSPEPEPTPEASETTAPEASATESPEPSPGTVPLQKGGTDNGWMASVFWGIAAAAAFILLCLSVWIWCRHSRGRYTRSLKKSKGKNSSAIRIMTEGFLCFLADCGIRGCDKMTEKEWIGQAFILAEGEKADISDAGSGTLARKSSQEDMDKMRQSIEKAFFSNEVITDGECGEFLKICDSLAEKILLQLKGWPKFFILFSGWRKQFAEWKKLCYDRTK